MGSPSFGMLPGNNAPTPIGGGTNPTGLVPGGFSTKESFGFPNYPMFGPPSNGIVTPTANLGIFGTPTANASPNGNTGMQGMNSGFGSNVGSQTQLENDYGKGIGDMLYNILNGGLFNQKTADAFLNAMQPAYNRGVASIETAFGAEGSRFGSAAALGIGDFSSQFNLNEQQTLASMYMQAQQEQLSLLENILPTVHAEQADSQSSGWLGDLLGGLEIVGGLVAAPFSGGLSLGLVGAGIGQIAKSNSHDTGGTGASMGGGANIPNIGMPSWDSGGLSIDRGNTGFGMTWDDMSRMLESQSAGAALGGYNDPSNPFGILSEGF